MDTPNYRAFDLVIEEEIKKAMGGKEGIASKKTRKGHFPLRETRLDNIRVKPVDISQSAQSFGDKIVDIDKAMANLAENSLMYNASAQILARKFKGLKDVIMGGGR